MLYHFFTWLNKHYNVPGAGLFQYQTFRIAMAILLSLLIATIYGKKIIVFLQKKQIGESVRDLGLEGQMQKKRNTNNGWLNHFVKHFNTNIVGVPFFCICPSSPKSLTLSPICFF